MLFTYNDYVGMIIITKTPTELGKAEARSCPTQQKTNYVCDTVFGTGGRMGPTNKQTRFASKQQDNTCRVRLDVLDGFFAESSFFPTQFHEYMRLTICVTYSKYCLVTNVPICSYLDNRHSVTV